MRTAPLLALAASLAALGCAASTEAPADSGADAFAPPLDASTPTPDAFVQLDAGTDAFVPPDAGPGPCTDDSECTDPEHPVCDGASGECVVCTSGDRGACGAGEYCAGGSCASGCETDSDCVASGGAEMRCRASDHACVGCVSDDQCALGTVCDAATSTCVAGCTAAHGCASADEDCCEGTCLDTSADVANCGGCGVTCGGVCAGGECALHPDCAAIHAADPTRPSGEYEIDPDGAGPGAPVRVYCDMTTDGGGWILVAVIRASSSAHRATGAVGVVSAPTQTTAAKLSDDEINRIRGDLGTSVIRFECGASVSYFQEDRPFVATADGSGAIMRCSSSASGPWEMASPFTNHYGLNTYTASSCPYMIYNYPAYSANGCYVWTPDDGPGVVPDDGLMWIRPGTAQ